MKKICAIFAIIAVVTFGFVVVAPSLSYALSIESAKSQGLVGEQPNGLLGAVQPNPSTEVRSYIKVTNAARLEKYQSIATRNNTPLLQIQSLAGKKLIREARSGSYIKNASGKWQQKP